MTEESEVRRARLLEELRELFGSALEPSIAAYGRSFAEHLCKDDEVGAQIRARYERGRVERRFRALSEYLAERSDEEIEEFFQSGWMSVALPFTEPQRNPWDYAPWDGDMEAYREDLYAGMAFALPDLRSFAQQWLEELVRVGYYGMEEFLGLPLKQADDPSTIPRPLPLYGEAYPVRLGVAGCVYWLQLDAGRSERGYRTVALSDEPLRTDRAILAALTSLEGRTLDMEKLRRMLPEIVPSGGESVWDLWTRTIGRPDSDRDLLEDLQSLGYHQSLDYALILLRRHRPGFDELPREERVALMAGVCEHINAFLQALRKLVAFIEYGAPGRRIPSETARIVNRDIRAAVLRDVDGMVYREIGEEIGVPPPRDVAYKGDHPTIRKMVKRGRKVLHKALGKEGWQQHAAAMRIEAQRWLSMSEAEREAETYGPTSEK